MFKRHIASILLAALLCVHAPAQERKPKVVEPVAVMIVTGGEDPDAREFHRVFRAELNKRQDVAIRRTRADWKLYLNATVIAAKGEIIGYAGDAMVMSMDCKLYWSAIKAGPTIEDLVKEMVAALDKGVFHPK